MKNSAINNTIFQKPRRKTYFQIRKDDKIHRLETRSVQEMLKESVYAEKIALGESSYLPKKWKEKDLQRETYE